MNAEMVDRLEFETRKYLDLRAYCARLAQLPGARDEIILYSMVHAVLKYYWQARVVDREDNFSRQMDHLALMAGHKAAKHGAAAALPYRRAREELESWHCHGLPARPLLRLVSPG